MNLLGSLGACVSLLCAAAIPAAAGQVASSAADGLYAHADTPERRMAIERVAADIAGLPNWGILTTKSYIVLYSWPADQPNKRTKYSRRAGKVGRLMDRMLELYDVYFPRPRGSGSSYAVLRIFATADEFRDYSKPARPDLLGLYSAASNELLLYIGADMVKARMVAYHEAWHQYSVSCFDGVEPHGWFDEGIGDYFGAFFWTGKRWHYLVSELRKADAKKLVARRAYVPLQEFVTWNKSHFAGAGAAYHYAQSYTLVDFLMRGRGRSRRWDDRWSEILSSYFTTLVETKDPGEAARTAFAGVDWTALTEAWEAWVRRF